MTGRRSAWLVGLGLAVFVAGVWWLARPRPAAISWTLSAEGVAECGSGVMRGEPLREALHGVLLGRAMAVMSGDDAATFAAYAADVLSAYLSGNARCTIAARMAHGATFPPGSKEEMRAVFAGKPARLRIPGWETWSEVDMAARLMGGGVGWKSLNLRTLKPRYVGQGESTLVTLGVMHVDREDARIEGPVLSVPGVRRVVALGPPTWTLELRGRLRDGQRVRVTVVFARYDVGKWEAHRMWVHEPSPKPKMAVRTF